MLPGIRPRAVGQGIAYGVVGDGLPVERRQQVRPIGIAAAAPERLAPSGDKFQGLAAEKVYYNRHCDTAELVESNSETFKGCCAYRYCPFLYLDLIREST